MYISENLRRLRRRLDILDRIAEQCTETEMRNHAIVMTAAIYAAIGEEE
ncbi:MAG: hypothetical protein GX254_05620 [Clostridiales bacterium]|mgnify:CR=1 FL=1|nr:hypothetical protein [Clostridiales bacterium]